MFDISLLAAKYELVDELDLEDLEQAVENVKANKYASLADLQADMNGLDEPVLEELWTYRDVLGGVLQEELADT